LLAEMALEEHVAQPLGVSVLEAARLVKRKIDSRMADAIFKEVATRGFEPRKVVLVSYGGAGPAHCCGFARELGVKRVVVPPFSPVFSAFGAANLGQLHIHERSVYLVVYNPLTREVTLDLETVNGLIAELEDLGREDLVRQGFSRTLVEHQIEFDMRYGNQLVQLSVLSPVSRLRGVDDILSLIDVFSDTYAKRYGERAAAPEAGVKIAAVRVLSWVPGGRVSLRGDGDGAATAREEEERRPVAAGGRLCHFTAQEEGLMTAVYRWGELSPGARIDGPAIVEAPHTTFVVESGWEFRLDANGTAWLTDRVS
jgi:N-methylhydantoinase A